MFSTTILRFAVRSCARCPRSQLIPRYFSLTTLSKPILLHKPTCRSLPVRQAHEGGTLLDTVKRELEYENERQQSLPEVDGFTANTDGTDVTLKKSFGDETVTVTFNINGTITPVETAPEAEGDEPDMLSTPPFTVTVEKPGKQNKLAVRCAFKDDTEGSGDVEAGFDVVELTLHTGDWNEKTYTMYGDVIDGAMYDQIVEMLGARGINQSTFCDQLVDFATEYEHKLYIQLLKSMDQFLN